MLTCTYVNMDVHICDSGMYITWIHMNLCKHTWSIEYIYIYIMSLNIYIYYVFILCLYICPYV